MGLLDVLGGMQNGPGGFRPGGGFLGGGGGMSPITGAVLGLLAYKAIKSFSAGQPPSTPGGSGNGSLADSLKNGLRGILGGGAGGSALSGGLGDLMKQFQQAGRGDVAASWVGPGANQPIAPHELEKVMTPDQVSFLMERTGLSHDELMAGLSEQLPKTVDHLTPQGRIPDDKEMAELI